MIQFPQLKACTRMTMALIGLPLHFKYLLRFQLKDLVLLRRNQKEPGYLC